MSEVIPSGTPCSPTSEEDSEVSLLETWSDDEFSVDSDSHGLDRIQKRFQKRGQAMAKVMQGKSPCYRDMILAREVASRKHTLRSSKSKDSVMLDPSSYLDSTFLFQCIHHLVLFETHHSMEAAWTAIWYCLGHLSIFMILDVLRRLAKSHSAISDTALHCFFVIMGLGLMRVNGYLWTWLGHDSYRVVKFDLHNRRILEHWDVQILEWFRQRPTIQNAMGLLGFYTLYLGVTHFYDQVWAFSEQWIWVVYGWWEDHVAVQLKTMNLDFESCNSILNTTSWSRYFSNFLCEQFSNKDLLLVCIVFDGFVVLVASLAMAAFGGSLCEE